MCSVDEEDAMPVKNVLSNMSSSKLCMKCGVLPAVTTARLNDPFCLQCFEVYFTHRFRATFGKAKVVRQGEQVLVGFSGGVSSRVLLKLIADGLDRDAPKKLRFTPTLVHIDETVLHTSKQQDGYGATTSRILCIARQNEFPVIYTRLEEVFASCHFWYLKDILEHSDSKSSGTNETMSLCKPIANDPQLTPADTCTIVLDDSIRLACPLSDQLQHKVTQVFDSVKTLSAKDKLLYLLRRKLLQKVACRLGYSKVLMGDSASLLSVRLLSNFAEGSGATVPLDTAFCDDREDVMVLRPLREFPLSEIKAFCMLKDLNTVESPELFPGGSSITRLTDTFVSGLQADFPSTISTIFRTGDKLSLDTSDSSHKCPLCQVPVGRRPPDGDVFSHIHLCSGSSSVDDSSVFLSSLCYGCCLILRDMVSSTLLCRYTVTMKMKIE